MPSRADKKPLKRPLTAIDLFSGAGGFSEGLAQAGIKTLLAQELHPQAALTHVFNHPDAIGVVGDVRKLQPELIKQLLQRHHGVNEVDIIVGGPPCQGFSTAGKKNQNDPRNTLFDDYCTIVEALKPKAIILENVPGFKKMYEGRIYDAALQRFEELGYRLKDKIVNAVDYGVPQRRKRFVLVGIRADLDVEFFWPEPTHQDPEGQTLDLFSPDNFKHISVADAIEDLAFLKPGFESNEHQVKPITEYQKERRKTSTLFNHLATEHRDRAVNTFKLIKEGCTIGSVPLDMKSSKKTMARLDRKHISNTVLALPDDLIHYSQHRIPTVREMARLQSFDDDYVFIGKRTSGFMDRKHDVPQYTQVGNAVPPLLSKALGTSLAQALGGELIDVRNHQERLKRHAWVRGTSAYSGYTLSSEAQKEINLYSIDGLRLELPIDDSADKVTDRDALQKWKEVKAVGRKKQWAPGVPAAPLADPESPRRKTRTPSSL